MSRLDWFTIAVVSICILAIGFLLLKTSSLLKNENSIMQDPTTELLNDSDSDLSEDDIYTDETIDPDTDDEDALAAKGSDSDESSEDLSDAATDGINKGRTDNDTSGDEDDADTEELAEETSRINTSPSASGNSGGNYMVVAGSFSQMINAENFVKKLKNQGYDGAEIGKFNAGKYATALAGRFDAQADAQALVAELKAKGIEAYIQKRK